MRPVNLFSALTVNLHVHGASNTNCFSQLSRFGEHYRKIKKPKKIDTFLYQHLKHTGHSPNNVLVQPVEKLSYDENSTVRFNTIKRFEPY